VYNQLEKEKDQRYSGEDKAERVAVFSAKTTHSTIHCHCTCLVLLGCPIGHKLLCKFRMHIEALSTDVGVADERHPLAAFAGNPAGCVDADEDAWEKFDGPLNTLLQKPPEELQHLVRVGEKGLIGLCHLLKYLVTYHQVSGVLLEGKLERLINAIDKVYVKLYGTQKRELTSY
jgi:hypothetical protein